MFFVCNLQDLYYHTCKIHTQNSGVTGPKFTQFSSDVDCTGVIGGVNALIHVAILPSVVECQRTE